MTSRSYFGKMNSTLGSVVPLAMFIFMCAKDNMKRVEGIVLCERHFNTLPIYNDLS